MNAMVLAEVEAAREKLTKEQAEAARALAARPREPTSAEMLSALCLRAVNVWSGLQDNARARAREEWEARQSGQRFVEEDRFAARRRQEIEEAEKSAPRTDHVAASLARKKVAMPVKEEPRTKTWAEWLGERFATPKKSVLR